MSVFITPLLVLCIGIFGYLMPAIGYFTMMPGDLGDARFNSVVLEHGYQWLIGRVPELWSPGFFYPFERILAFSDNHFGSFWSYAAARSLGAPRELSFQIWFVVGCVLNYAAGYWMLRRMGFDVLGASCGAFVFAFALPVLHQEGHAQLTYRFAIPLAILAWWRVVEQKSLIDVFTLLFWLSVQFLCSIYLGVFLGYLLVALFFAYVACKVFGFSQDAKKIESFKLTDLREPRVFALICLSLLACGLVIWMLVQYQSVSAEYRLSRPIEALEPLIPRFSSYLLADQSGLTSWIGKSVRSFPTRPEHQMFIGVGVLLFLLVGLFAVVSKRYLSVESYRLGIVSAISILILVAMTVVVNGSSLYFLVIQLPGLDAIRAVSRIILVMLLPVSILVAVGVDCLRRQFTSVVGYFVLALVAMIVISAETVFYKPHQAARETWTMRQAGLNHLIGKPPSEGSVIYLTQRKEEPFYLAELDAMIYAQDHKLKTLNGYSGSTPPGYVYPEPCVSVADRLAGYFQFRQVPIEEQKRMIDQVRLVEMQPCVKAAK
jgi:hypothetical protein